jgi:hypothetical protein
LDLIALGAILIAFALASLAIGLHGRLGEARSQLRYIRTRNQRLDDENDLLRDERNHAIQDADDAEARAAAAESRVPEPVAVVPVPPTPQQIEEMKALRCVHCGGVHSIACPRIKRMRFRADGTSLYEIEFWDTWDQSRVAYIEDYTVDSQNLEALPQP